MAKNSIRDYSATNSANTDIQSIDISEGCSPAGINNAIREVMADLKDVSTGAVALESPAMDSLTVTGSVTADGLTVDGTAQIGSDTAKVKFYSDSTYSGIFNGASLGSNENFYMGSGSLFFYSGGAERMRIDSSGNVGIGTSSPDVFSRSYTGTTTGISSASGETALMLNSSGTNVTALEMGRAGTRELLLYDTSIFSQLYTLVSKPFIFGTNGTERMRIDTSGRLLVGNTGYNIGQDGAYLQSAGSVFSRNTTSGATQVNFGNPNGVVGTISTTGTSTSYNTSSDYRLKENVTADWDATTRLKQLNPVRFNFIADADTTVDGFLAHEVQDIVPEAISGTKDGMRDEEYQVSAATGDIYTPATDDVDEVIHSTDVERPEELAEGQQWRETTAAVMGTRSVPDYQGIDQSKLVPLLVKTIQELEARITALEAN
jgi:hypothetical protein